jgi:outer membrane protein
MLRRIVSVCAAAGLLAIFAPVGAMATTVLVIDMDRVLSESAVGQHIQTELSAIAEEIGTELETEETAVRAEVETFNTDTEDKTEEEIIADEALNQRRIEIQNQLVELGVSQQVKERELAATRNQALEPVLEALNDVLDSVVEARGGDVLLERPMVVYVGENADITEAVIAELNATMTTVEVERIRLPVAEESSGD